MKRKTLITSIALIVIGFMPARVGDSLSTVTGAGQCSDADWGSIGYPWVPSPGYCHSLVFG